MLIQMARILIRSTCETTEMKTVSHRFFGNVEHVSAFRLNHFKIESRLLKYAMNDINTVYS